ncbi:unnamed protein product, partial [Choristocarpus tenellus]
MMRPQIQNDFASYRRLLPKVKDDLDREGMPDLPILDTEANAVSMFIAENVPFTVMLAKVISSMAEWEPRVVQVIAIVANMCCGMVHRGNYSDKETERRLLMSMTSAVVLYDRITDTGVFVRHSSVGVS